MAVIVTRDTKVGSLLGTPIPPGGDRVSLLILTFSPTHVKYVARSYRVASRLMEVFEVGEET